MPADLTLMVHVCLLHYNPHPLSGPAESKLHYMYNIMHFMNQCTLMINSELFFIVSDYNLKDDSYEKKTQCISPT